MNSFIFKMFNKTDDTHTPNPLNKVSQGQSTIPNPTNELNEEVLEEYDMLNLAAEDSNSDEEITERILDINILPEYKKAEERYLSNTEITKDQLIDIINNNLLSTKDFILKAISLIDKEIIEIQIDQKEFFEAKIVASKVLENYKKRSNILNKNLSESIKIEKYREADSIQQEVETIAEGIRKTKAQLNNLSTQIDSNEQKKISLQKKKKKILALFISVVNDWTKQEENDLDKYSKNIDTKINTELTLIESEKEKITALEHVIESSRKMHDEKIRGLDEIIAMSCRNLIETRNTLQKEMKTIESEIEELERVLKEKKTEKNKRQEEVNKIQNEIDIVKRNYEPQQKEILNIEKSLRDTENNIGMVVAKIDTRKAIVEKYKETKIEKLTSRNLIISELNLFKEECEQLNNDIETYIDQIEKLNKDLNSSLQLFNDIKEKMEELEEKERKAKEKISKNDWEMKDCLDQITNLKAQIIKFDEEKKVLAEARRFKEAAKISNDLKVFHSKLEEQEKRLEQTKVDKEILTKEMVYITEELLKGEKEEEDYENGIAILKYERINCGIAELEGLINNKELDETEIKILEDQLTALKTDKKDLEAKHHALILQRENVELREEDKELHVLMKQRNDNNTFDIEETNKTEEKLTESEELSAKIKELEQMTNN